MRWNSRATVSRERGGAPVTTVAAARLNAAPPVVGSWCWWLEEVEVIVEQPWLRRISQRGYVGYERLRWSYGSS